MIFADFNEVQLALNEKVVDLHAKIKCRMEYITDDGELKYGLVETTPGRIIVSETLPKHKDVPFSLVNRLIRKKEIGEIIDTIYRHCGQKKPFCLLIKLWLLVLQMLVKPVFRSVKMI